MRDSLTSYGILLVVQGEDDLGGMLKVIDRGVSRDDMVPNKEHKFQEGPGLNFTVVARALDVFAGPEAEVESKLYQVGTVPGLWVGGGGSCVHDGLDGALGGAFSLLECGILNPISFELVGYSLVQADVSLGVGGGFLGQMGHPGGGPLQSPPPNSQTHVGLDK